LFRSFAAGGALFEAGDQALDLGLPSRRKSFISSRKRSASSRHVGTASASPDRNPQGHFE
jgi:hypothetical protein